MIFIGTVCVRDISLYNKKIIISLIEIKVIKHQYIFPAAWVFLVGIAICGNAGGQTQPDDHGNTFADATPISLDTSITGVIQNRDFDYFRLEIFSTVDVRIFTEGNTDTVGSLFDDSSPDPILLVENGDISPGNFLISYRLSPSTYYITVRGLRPDTTGTYTLTVQTDDLIDMDGDTTATATMISLDTSRTGVLHIRDDVDYFELEIRSTVDVSIFTESNIDTMGRLFDDSETLLVVNGDLMLDNFLIRNNFLIRSRLPPGTYYISVQPNRGVIFLSEDPYTLTVQTDALMDRHGDTTATATTIRLNTSMAGELYGGNVDYFRIEVSSTVDVELLTESRTDTTGRLYDGLFRLVAFNDDQINPATGRQLSRDFRIFDRLYPDSGPYYIEVRGFSSFTGGEYKLTLRRANYTPLSCPPSGFNDPLYGCQWHLNNTGQTVRRSVGIVGEDINVESVWATYKGEGVHVAVVDGGLHSTHEDLRDNVVTTLNHDYTPDTPLIYNQADDHGTAVGGLIAARDDNDLGVRGVAPRATISGYNFLDSPSIINAADAMTRNRVETDVSNNSWGVVPYRGTLSRPGSVWEMAVDTGVNEGADGKGIVYVWAAGNGAREGANSNYDGYNNYYAVTAVCAVNNGGIKSIYSELGANLWVCAPSGDNIGNIVTTDNAHRYRNNFSGTSASAPIVSGVVALVRQANSELSWRDVKLILAASARWTDMMDPDWEEGAYQYQSAAERYRFNHKYGFGVVDAQAAVDLAQDWKNVPPMNTTESAIMPVNQIIPDNSATGITHSLEIASDIEFIEFVEINIDFEHPSFADLDTQLISPAGTISELTDNRNISPEPVLGSYRLGSAKHLGEDPSGTWRLRVSDRRTGNEGRLNAWSLKIYGHSTPRLIATTSEQLTEQNLRGAELILTLNNLTWEEPFEPNAFSLNGAPTGVSIDIDRVMRNSSATATLILAFDGTDFDDNAAVSVMVMETAHSGDESLESVPLIITANHEATGMPLIEGTPRVNETLTAMVGTIADGDGLLSAVYEWQWQASTDGVVWEDIESAATADFMPALTHQDQFLRVLVSFMDDGGFRESSTSTATGEVLGIAALTISTQTTLNEVNLDGAELDLTLVHATWNTSLQPEDFNLDGAPTGVDIVAIERRSDTTITLTLAFDGTDFDADAMVSVLVSMAAFNDADSLMSQPIIFRADPEASIMGIYSPPFVFMTLEVSAVWNAALSDTDFKLNGVPPEVRIMDVLRNSDLGAQLVLEGIENISMDSTLDFSVTILATAYSGFRELSVGPFPLSGNYEATGMPDIVGTPQVGVSLTATIGDIADINGLNNVMSMSVPGLTYNWQWQVSVDEDVWLDIAGADTETLIPLPVHQGRFLRVLARFIDDASFQESRVSTATAAVLAPPSVTVFTAEPLTELNLNGATLTLVITGASWETTLQVDDFSLVDAPLGLVIIAVERNTDTTAILTVEFNGTDFDDSTAVSVQTSNTAIAEYVGAAVISTSVVDILANDEAVGEPTIAGVAQVSVSLTANSGTITDGNGLMSAVYEWQWQASTDRVIWEDIAGADTETWIPLSVHRGQFLRVLVSFTDDDGFRESSTSTATAAVLAPPAVIILVPQAAVGSTYDFTIPDDILTELGSETPTYTITVLPDGLSFNEGDRTINGVPESTGIYTVVIEASNSTELLIVNFELIIVAAGFPIVVNPLESYEVVADVFFEFNLVDQQIFMDSTPIVGTLMYRVMREDLQPWLMFNDETGVFSGTPDGSVRRIPVSVSAIDEDGNENVYVIAFDVLVNLRMRLKVFLEGAQ